MRWSAGAAVNGSWRVLGNSGSVPVHALPFTNDLLLFLQRGNNANGTSFNPVLIVRAQYIRKRSS